MITINLRLVGGLGNQLYQLAAALVFTGQALDTFIKVDSSGMGNYKEDWGVLLFDILDETKLRSRLVFEESFVLQWRVARLFGRSFLAYKAGIISDKNFDNYLNGINPYSKNIYLDGYFQKPNFLKVYVNNLTPFLRSDLKIPVENNVVVINVRGGEFLNLGWSSDQDKDIYENFIKNISNLLQNPKFHVVTDDIDYAKQILSGVCYVEKYHEPNPFNNFRMIYSSKFKIISRSTFAQWAAFLSSDFSDSYFLS